MSIYNDFLIVEIFRWISDISPFFLEKHRLVRNSLRIIDSTLMKLRAYLWYFIITLTVYDCNCVGWNAGLCVLFFILSWKWRKKKYSFHTARLLYEMKKKRKLNYPPILFYVRYFFTIVVVLKKIVCQFSEQKKYSFCFVVSIQRSYILKNIIKGAKKKNYLQKKNQASKKW